MRKQPPQGWKSLQIPKPLYDELAVFTRELEDLGLRDSRRIRIGLSEATRIAIRRGIDAIRQESR